EIATVAATDDRHEMLRTLRPSVAIPSSQSQYRHYRKRSLPAASSIGECHIGQNRLAVFAEIWDSQPKAILGIIGILLQRSDEGRLAALELCRKVERFGQGQLVLDPQEALRRHVRRIVRQR